MDPIYVEFERQLAEWRQRYERAPQQEMEHLCLLALEREEIVAVAYRDRIMDHRFQSLAMPAYIRTLIRHALTWIWRDEEMHTIYIRGALLSLGGPRLRLQVLLQQMAGYVAGWASAVQHHVRWREAPVSRGLAALFTGLGVLARRVPAEVMPHLQYRTFRQYCEFNIGIERTAALCWQRLVQLAEETRRHGFIVDFRRIQADEDDHTRLFEVIRDCFSDQDELLADATEAKLSAQLRAIRPNYVPFRWRQETEAPRLVGSGSPVWVSQGDQCSGLPAALAETLAQAGLRDVLRSTQLLSGLPVEALRVVIKTTFMMGYDRTDRSALVDPAVIEGLARHLTELGCRDIVVAEADNLYDRYFQHRSVAEVAAYFGFASPFYRVVNLSLEQEAHQYQRGVAQSSLATSWKQAHVRIVVGKLRSHPIEDVYLTLGALEGVGQRMDDFLFYERQAERRTVTMMVLEDAAPDFALLDAWCHAPDGLVGIMGARPARHPHRLYASRDCLALDLCAARHLGARHSPLLKAACDWFGDPTPYLQVRGQDQSIEPWRGPYRNELTTLLSLLSSPMYVLASGHGAAFVPAMDPDAFPPSRPVPWWLSAQRRLLRRLLGYGLT